MHHESRTPGRTFVARNQAALRPEYPSCGVQVPDIPERQRS